MKGTEVKNGFPTSYEEQSTEYFSTKDPTFKFENGEYIFTDEGKIKTQQTMVRDPATQ